MYLFGKAASSVTREGSVSVRRRYVTTPQFQHKTYPRCQAHPLTLAFVHLEVEVKLRPKVSRPVRLGVRHPSGTRDQFFFLLEIFFRQLRVCYLKAPSLTRGLVYNLLLLLVLASAAPLGSESRGTQDHILLNQFLRLPQPGGPGPRIYIPQEQVGPDISPGTGFPIRRLLRLTGLRWRYSIPPPHGIVTLKNI
jgi:hypothetical protein